LGTSLRIHDTQGRQLAEQMTGPDACLRHVSCGAVAAPSLARVVATFGRTLVNVTLLEFAPAHLPFWAEWIRVGKILDHMSRCLPTAYESGTRTPENTLWWVIVADDQPIGSVWIERKAGESRTGDLGIFIGDPGSRGVGIGKTAAILAERRATAIWGVELVRLRVRASNERAIRCYARIGYRETRSFEKELHDGSRTTVLEMEHHLQMPNQSTDPTLASGTPLAGPESRHP